MNRYFNLSHEFYWNEYYNNLFITLMLMTKSIEVFIPIRSFRHLNDA